MIDWAKGGAGRMLKRAQRRTFDRRRPHAAPNLIDKVLAMTAPLAALARLASGQAVPAWRPYRQIGVVQPLTLYDAITRFIDRENARVAAWNAEHPTACDRSCRRPRGYSSVAASRQSTTAYLVAISESPRRCSTTAGPIPWRAISRHGGQRLCGYRLRAC